MNVAIFTDNFLPQINGVVTVIIKLIDNETLYYKFKKNNKEMLKKHDMKNVISEYEKTFKDVIKNYKKSS